MRCPFIIVAVVVCMACLVYAAEVWVGVNAEPSDQAEAVSSSYTYIYNEAATADGSIDSIEVYIADPGSGAQLQFAVFHYVSGTTFRDSVISADINVSSAGLEVYAIDPPMAIKTGQYLGFYTAGCTIDRAASGPGAYYLSSDNIDDTPGNLVFTAQADKDMQVRAYTGESAGGTGQIIMIGN